MEKYTYDHEETQDEHARVHAGDPRKNYIPVEELPDTEDLYERF